MSRRTLPGFLIALLLMSSAVPTQGQTSAVNWRTNYDAAKIEAAQSGKLLLLHFYTTSCGPCKVLDRQVFNQPHVAAALEQNYIPVKIDAKNSPALAGMYRIERWPTDVILTPQSNLIATFGCPNKPEAYLTQLNNLAAHFRGTTGTQPAAAAQQAIAQTTQPQVAAYRQLGTTSTAFPQPQTQPRIAPSAAAAASAPAPQFTTNPYAAGPTGRVAPPATTAPGVAATAAATPGVQNAPTTPAMPPNAMPQSYRNSFVDQSPAAAAPTATSAASTTNAAPSVATAAPSSPAMPSRDASSTPATRQAVASAPTTPTLPPGSPELGFDGYCPVTLMFANKWVQGKVAIGMEHRGRLYLFASEQQREQFAANPDAFAPVFSGLDPVLMLDQNQAVNGSRKYGFKYRGLFYVFSSEETKQKFAANPDAYAIGVRQAMHRIDAQGDVIRR